MVRRAGHRQCVLARRCRGRGSGAGAALLQGPLMAENYFKNIQVLKGMPVDEFMDAMGMFSASLGYDCVSCHSSELYNNRDAFAIATPMVQRARQMIVMMNAINKQYFGGQPRMSCFTCHRGQDRPGNIPSLAHPVRRADGRPERDDDLPGHPQHRRAGLHQVPDGARRRAASRRAHQLRRDRHLCRLQHRRQRNSCRCLREGAEPARAGRAHAGRGRHQDL